MSSADPGIALLGGGGHCSDVLAVIEALRSVNRFIGHVWIGDDNWSRRERFDRRRDLTLVDSIDEAALTAPYILAVGYPTSREVLHNRVTALGAVASGAIVHPDASIGSTSEFDPGVVVMGQSWISPGVHLREHTHVGYGAAIGHDTQVGPFASIMPAASIGGDCSIGAGCLIGANATVLQGLAIGPGATVGAGATVTKDVAAGQVVVGTPARASSASKG